MDLYLGQTIIEFRIGLGKELETGIVEIERYTRILADKGQKVAECIITKRALSRANYILAHKWSLIPFSLDFTDARADAAMNQNMQSGKGRSKR